MSADWHDHEARTRVRVRLDNESTASAFDHTTAGVLISLVCECGSAPCEAPIHVTHAEYESVRSSPRRFVIALNHENPEAESVVGQSRGFAVVETLAGEASRIAEETDPRAEPLIGPWKEAQ